MSQPLQLLHQLLLPEPLSSHFEIVSYSEKSELLILRLEELKELVPEGLSNEKGIVLDGFCNQLELQTFPLKGKAVYLHVYRRRWKLAGTNRHFSNQYDLHPPGVKATKEFASFLKGALGQTPGEHNAYRDRFMH